MLKVYLSSVAVWFLIAMAEGLLFREQFRKSRDMVREHLKTKDKMLNNIDRQISIFEV